MNLLQIEWLKIKKYTTFWVLAGLFIVLFFMWNFNISRGFMKLGNVISSSYSFPSIWANMGYLYGWFVIFLCVFIIISISNEFTFRTHRQNIIDGLSRLDFLHAKLFLIVAISVTASLIYFLMVLLFGFINGGGNAFDGIEKLFYVFLYTINYLLFSAVLAFLIRRSGLSIILLFAYLLFEMGISSFINYKTNSQFGNLMPLQSSDELLPLNALKSASSMFGIATKDLDVSVYIIASFAWIGIYYTILRQKILTTDL